MFPFARCVKHTSVCRFGSTKHAAIVVGFVAVLAMTSGAAIAQTGNAPPRAAEVDSSEINATNWYWGPENQWSWHNTRRIFPSAQVSRGVGPIAQFAAPEQSAGPDANLTPDIAKISFADPVSHKPMTVAQMLDATYTDGFLVLHHGQVLTESYRNGMTAEDPHLIMSVSKSIIGTLAGILVDRGQLDPRKLVTDYIPELKGTLYDGATVRNLLDMSVDDPQAREEAKTAEGTAREYEAVDEAGGWLPRTATSAPGFRAYFAGLKRPHGDNGRQFQYLDESAILIGWVTERAAGKDLSTLLTEDLWSKLGAEQDAYILLDAHQQAYSSAGFNATLRDMARFGQMMAQGGRYNGQQIVPAKWVEDIRTNGSILDKDHPGLAAPAPWPGHAHGTYRSFWWVSAQTCGRFAGVGLGGQLLVIDPIADMVVVKLDSVPRPELDDAVFETQYKAIDAIIAAVSGHGCS
jgi:CubicO group peptidase (beta-lactamase class C family)